jgi:sulfite exporter TauE/SafE
MNLSWLLAPLLAGLSTGIYCLTTCFPFITSCLVAEERHFSKNLALLGQFILGRLIGYIAFGLFFGFLGEKINREWINVIADLSLIFLSLVFVFYLLRILRQKPSQGCAAKRISSVHPLAMGFLMGINFCPPFLLSLTFIFTLHSAFKGMLYFILFFISSTVYFLPLIFFGMLSRLKEFRNVGILSGFLVALLFSAYGIYSVSRNLRGLWTT